MSISWNNYNSKNSYDEYLTPDKKLRKEAKVISKILNNYSSKDLASIENNCQSTISSRGINFKVYSADKKAAEEKKWPLDIISRIIPKTQWNKISKGLIQRVKALNLFIDDVYNKKKIFKDKIIPKDLIFESPFYLKECEGFSPKYKAWSNISGIDLIRNINGEYLVLEDNLRVPSVLSYMLENRMVMRDVFPELFTKYKVSSVHQYSNRLNIPVRNPLTLKSQEEIKHLKKIKPDIVIVVAYGKILPSKLLNLEDTVFINVHASLLPKWRGAAPIQRAIMNCDHETGISIMRVEPKLDTGPVLMKSKIKITKDINYEKLSSQMSRLGAKLILESLDLIEKDKANGMVPVNKQSHLRPLATINQVNKCISILKSKPKIKRSMWSRRAQEYESKISSGKIYELAEVVRDLNKGDDLMVDQSYSERQLFEKAYERILSEFQIILGISLEDTQKKLDKSLKRNLENQPKPAAPVAKSTTTELPEDEPVSESEEPLEE